MPAPPASFDRFGPADPQSPVVLSVPHAGRDYPLAARRAARVPMSALAVFEDRHVDAVAIAARGGETLFVQRRARAWIDLNRAETDRDPAIDEGAHASRLPFLSAKLRSGLGLVPRRVPGHGDAWSRRFGAVEIAARIAADHRPYHAALSAALASARDRFGTAVLLDLHSMPSIAPPGEGAEIVLGDRFGRSAGARFVHRLEAEAEAASLRCALNAPYSGGHILDRHAAPQRGIHAVQLEIDRALYLGDTGEAPGPGLAETAKLVRSMIDALADEALSRPQALAAE